MVLLGGKATLRDEVVAGIEGVFESPFVPKETIQQQEEQIFVFGTPFVTNGVGEEFGTQLTQFNTFLGQRAPFVTEGSQADSLGIISYTVQPGDTPGSIAKQFGITTETVLSANDLRYGDYIGPGEVLLVLPTSGVLHKVVSGQTLASIAKQYTAKEDEIAKYNLIAADGSNLAAGQILIVPNGKKFIGVAPPAYGTSLAKYDNYYAFPTTGRNWGRRHDNNGVDISNSCGTEIYAAAAGTAYEIKTTNSTYRFANGGYGNYIKITHDNGTQTLYGHLLSVLVNEGDQVSKGQLIAWMGGRPGAAGSGNSTGCHLHFEVRGAKNPFIRF